jgi:hypothetical protein
MKKYINFIKLNESNDYDLDKLDIDESTITDYFSKNYDFLSWHSIDMLKLDYFIDYLNTDRLNSDMYSEFKEGIEQGDEDEDNVKEFLKLHESSKIKHDEKMQGYGEEIDELFKEKIIDELDKNDFDDEESFNEEVEMYNDYSYDEKIDELDINDLKNIINWDDYILEKWHSWYNGSGLEWLEMIYGEFVATKRDRYSYGYSYSNTNSDQDKYDAIKDYIDWDKLDDSLEDDFDFDYKKEFFSDQIEYSDEIQEEIFNYNNKNSFLLFDKMKNNAILGKDEEFQESYIHEYIIDDFGESLEDLDEDDKKIGMKDVLLILDKKFGINKNIEIKYIKYMGVVKARKFNL